MSSTPQDLENKRKLELYERAVELAKKKRVEEELPHLFGFKPYQWTLDYWNSTNRLKFLVAGNQASKAEPLDSLIPTPNGFKQMKDLVVGDEVFSPNGEPVKIKSIPWEGEDLFYKITFDDGDSIVVSKDHDWNCMGPDERFRKTYTKEDKTWENPDYLKWKVKSTHDIYKDCYDGSKVDVAKNRYVIPMCKSVQYSTKKFVIDPYLLGLLIGDGSLTSGGKIITVNTRDKKIIEYLESQGATKRKSDKLNCAILGVGFVSDKINKLKLNVLSIHKKIPSGYLLGSVEQRKALLAGLMDTDGTVSATGKDCCYSTSSPQLARDVKELASSLGCMAEVKKYKAGYKKNGLFKECHPSYKVNIFSEFNPFYLSDFKVRKWQKPKRYKHQKVIYKITPFGLKKGRCIEVEGGSYLTQKSYIVTHNSSSQIRHMIDLATNPPKWKKFFMVREPRTFWYIYPDGNKVSEEVEEKWIPEFMPRGSMRNHPQYGWEKIIQASKFKGFKFNTGVSIYFKTWRQDFQAATIDMIGIDEEIPFSKYDELIQRLTIAKGVMSMAFTATLGQREWFETIELKGKHGERFPNAFKRQISLEYDCKYYADGTPSMFTDEEIRRRKALCSSEREINRRVHGRFVSDEGLAFPSFQRTNNVKKAGETDRQWLFYGGIDIGTGGRDGHPAAIAISAIHPKFQKGKLYRFWMGNQYETTNTSQILNKYIEMTRDLRMTGSFYDWHSKEFYLRAQAAGVPLIKADKAQDFGVDLMNTLFRNRMYDIEEGEHIDNLLYELENLKIQDVKLRKTRARDDACDAVRYSLSSVPWDFSNITMVPEDDEAKNTEPIHRERGRELNRPRKKEHEDEWGFEQDIEEFNELLGGF